MNMIGIIGAMQSEITLLRAQMQNEKQTVLGNKVYYEGVIAGQAVVLTQSGMGKVNAAMCAQQLIDRFGVDKLINTGIAGGVALGLHVGDIVIADKTVEHDFDLTPVGCVKGCLGGNVPKDEPTYYYTDKVLVEYLQKAAQQYMSAENIHIGCIATGDQFVSSKEVKQELRTFYNAYAAEMEGGAIVHVAGENGVSAVIVRCLSDLADENAHESVDNFEQLAADRSADILVSMLKLMSD